MTSPTTSLPKVTSHFSLCQKLFLTFHFIKINFSLFSLPKFIFSLSLFILPKVISHFSLSLFSLPKLISHCSLSTFQFAKSYFFLFTFTIQFAKSYFSLFTFTFQFDEHYFHFQFKLCNLDFSHKVSENQKLTANEGYQCVQNIKIIHQEILK